MNKTILAASLLLLASGLVEAQVRDTKVRNDRKTFEGSTDWVYNDLDEGVRVARDLGKPLLVIFRCIPCPRTPSMRKKYQLACRFRPCSSC